ncbi:hypothetical protein TNCV_4248511 [Trichonephila clavipes]|nr:hypothetical protein TNCV_4248511 [Trichonephila clavipes]
MRQDSLRAYVFRHGPTGPGPKASLSVEAYFASQLCLKKIMIHIILMVKYYFRIYSPKNREFQTACQLEKVVAAIRHISHSCLDPNDFTVVNCIVKGHASLSPPSLRLRLCSRFTLLATYTYFDPKDFSPHPIDSVKGHASLSPLAQQKAKKKRKKKETYRFTK